MRKKIKIVQFISSLSLGGAEKLVVHLCNEFSTYKEVEIFLCVLYENSEKLSFKSEIDGNVKYLNFRKRKRLDFFLQYRIIRFLGKEKPQIVNSHLSGTLLYLYLPALLYKKIKFFHTIHNLAGNELPNKKLQLIRLFFYRVRRLIPISISKVTESSHVSLYGIGSSIIYNGIKSKDSNVNFINLRNELRSAYINSQTKIFLSIGSIYSPKNQKNFQLLVDVFKELQTRGENVALIIIGDDSSAGKETLKRLEASKSINTHFIGPRLNPLDYMRVCDYYCASSIFEGFPITVIEALSQGKPVISTSVGGISEIIENDINGLLVNDLSVETYVDKITELLSWSNDKIERVKQENLLKFQALFTIEIACKNYYDLYQKHLMNC